MTLYTVIAPEKAELSPMSVRDCIIEETCCFTGHRELPEDQIGSIYKTLTNFIESLINQGVRFFAAGGALGFDMLASRAVLALREIHPDIRLILVLPCRNQDAKWRKRHRESYRNILACADKTVYISEKYIPGCMHARNRRLVEESAHCICYLTRPDGGTAYTVRYAGELGRNIINIVDYL